MRAASGVKWDAGLHGVYGPCETDQADSPLYTSPLSQSLDIKEVLREKSLIGDVIESNTLHVIVLSYDSYCRMRALLKRLEGVEEEAMKSNIVKALGGFVVPSRRTRLLFCRDVFDYPELEGHDLLCNHLAPKLQGRPRKKRRRRPDSESESSETSEDQKPRIKIKPTIMTKSNTLIRGLNPKAHSLNMPKLNASNSLPSQIKNEFSTPAWDRLIEVDFMSKLYKFMKERNTAITRLPYIGFKQLNVFELFTRVQQYGGYEIVGQKKLWKHLYEDIVGKQGHQHNPAQNLHSGVNGLKRHYERLLLPYENYLLQEQKKILMMDARKSSHKSQKLLPKHHKHHHHHHHHTSSLLPSQHQQSQNLSSPKHSSHHNQHHNNHHQLQKTQQQNHEHQQNQQYQLSQQQQQQQLQVKNDPAEPSVSILQPVLPDPFGASFQVADGGSTTITLVPVSEPPDQYGGGASSSSGSGHGSDRSSPPPVLNNQSLSNVQIRPDSPPLHLPSSMELTVPKVNAKKENPIPADLAKRPEITITPIPRSLSSLGPGTLTSLQLADLMTLNVNLNSTLGVSALQDLAKIAERYDKATSEPSLKKHKSDDMTRLNGANQRNNNNSASVEITRSRSPPPSFHETHLNKNTLSVPDLVSADFLRQMNMLDSNSKLLLPAHQSTKTINALAALLPQTSIFPAPAPAAHQHIRSSHKPQVDSTKPEPVFQSLSVYSQSKNIYGKPTADVTKESSKDNNRSSSPDIEILDLRIPNESKTNRISKNERLEMELLDLSTRRDITVSAVPKPGSSKNSNTGKIPPPHVSIKSTDNGKSLPYSSGSSSHTMGSSGKSNSSLSSSNHSAAALASAFAAQGIPPALASLGMSSPSLLQYLVSTSMKNASSSQGSLPMFPYLDPAAIASYYSLLPHGLLQPSSQTGSNSSTAGSSSAAAAAAAAAAAQQAAAAAQLAQLNSLGLGGIPNVSPEAIASLGIYKNYLPQGNLPPPHFLSGLMSPGGPNPPTSK
ncbi:AT-rich interactive domain-containing protein 5B [Armadillidium nasatum]|uniref:AT-rich interactive domain-containing protein 5B n=1 Tax=Armadillidium nasatum TaxID=96803 RepID=A0A5N5SWN9_9CRUS|nr:AT-rich interactive domain-containing protein 5B [Armadillidium nasatum]